MGERKGQNFYYPPDFNYKTHKTLNGYHGTHALRERAKKIDQGILVIRFEMPFNIWCLGCHNHVGMGVRYNAEKKKIGMYYTTPLYEFRMKCHLCDNYYVIHTDPKNFDYALVEGCSRQERRYDPSDIDQLGAVDRGFQQKLAADAMFKKEHEEGDQAKSNLEEKRVEGIEWIQERMRDDFAANSYLRAQFRKEKKNLNESRARDDNLRDKLSISTTQLLPETEMDKRMASMMTRYRDVRDHDDAQSLTRHHIEARRIFGGAVDDTPSTSSGSSGASASTSAAERLKASMKMERDKKINDTFSTTATIKRKSVTQNALGILVRPKKVGKRESDHGDEKETSKIKQVEENSGEPTNKMTKMEPKIDPKEEEAPSCSTKPQPQKTPVSLIAADYGSSDSD